MSTSALAIAVSALRTHSYAIETTSHNIANAGTEGYRRQRVDIQTNQPRYSALGAMGSGVYAYGVSRAEDLFGDERVRSSAAQAGFFASRSQLADRVETIIGEPDNGLSRSLNEVWTAFGQLSAHPSDGASRYQTISALNGFASRVNEIRSNLDTLAGDSLTRMRAEIDKVNALAARVAEINTFARQPGGLPADLADERDRNLDQLAELVGARAQMQADGRVRVTVDGLAIVDAERATPLSLAASPAGQVQHPAGPVAVSGLVGGIQTSLLSDIPGFRTQLDAFVADLVSTLNGIHNGGFTPDGLPGGDLLEDVGGEVSVVVSTPDEIAATDTAGAALNNKIADALAQQREPLGEAYRSVVTTMAGTIAGLGRSAETAESISSSAAQSRDSVVGVNLDEELTTLLSQQRAYEAAARVITVVDELLETLIRM
jgi:flagellar hook-associated protein 1 FlgK